MLKEIFGMAVITVFTLGWMDLGQGPDYTWWKLIVVMGGN